MKHQAGDDFQTGGFLREPGGYHFCITGVEENPTKRGGALIDNAAFRVTLETMKGTVPGTEGKTADMCFFHPKPDGKNAGAFARKKMDRFFLAVCLMSEDDKGKEVDVDLAKAIGRQFKANMELDDDQKFLQVAFADIFHVDDPAAKHIPVNEAMLKLIPPLLRRIGQQPAKDAKAKDAATNAKQPSKQEGKQAPPKSATEEFDL